ncbi:MAG TPA: hypothetical protein VJH20_00940 [Candidatus Nanoarchaeia archaeon]|nr:hypothetical protein [Candidatus Nanoarchaeia archaeon]
MTLNYKHPDAPLYIGSFNSIDEIFESDRQELTEINGSTSEIGHRIHEIIEFAQTLDPAMIRLPSAQEFILQSNKLRSNLIQEYKTYRWHKNPKAVEKYVTGLIRLKSFFAPLRLDSKVSVVDYTRTILPSTCPFQECEYSWSTNYLAINPTSEVALVVSPGIEHLALTHDFLPKGHPSKIIPKTFYDNFIP